MFLFLLEWEQFLKYVAVDKEGSADKEFEAHEKDLGARRPNHGGSQVSGDQHYSGIEFQNKYMYSSIDSARNSGSLQFRSTWEIIRVSCLYFGRYNFFPQTYALPAEYGLFVEEFKRTSPVFIISFSIIISVESLNVEELKTASSLQRKFEENQLSSYSLNCNHSGLSSQDASDECLMLLHFFLFSVYSTFSQWFIQHWFNSQFNLLGLALINSGSTND